MANYQFSADLVDDILFRAGDLTDGTSDFNAVALQYLNRALFALAKGGSEIDPEVDEKWWWLRKYPPGVLTLEPFIDTGTVNVTNNLNSITFSSAPAASKKDWFLKTDKHADIFRISAHTAGAAAATLDGVYTGETDTAANYRIFRLEYGLASDVLMVISPMRVYQDSREEIQGMDLTALESRWPLSQVKAGVPWAFAHVKETTVRFSHYGGDSSTDLIRAEYDYIFRPTALTDSGTEEPDVPWMYRPHLADFALFLLFMDKKDSRADAAMLLAQRALRAMARENRNRMVRFGRDYGKIFTRPASLPENQAPLRTESGVIIG